MPTNSVGWGGENVPPTLSKLQQSSIKRCDFVMERVIDHLTECSLTTRHSRLILGLKEIPSKAIILDKCPRTIHSELGSLNLPKEVMKPNVG